MASLLLKEGGQQALLLKQPLAAGLEWLMADGENLNSVLVALNLVKQAVEGIVPIIPNLDPKATEFLPEAMLLLGGKMLSNKVGPEKAVRMIKEYVAAIETAGFGEAVSTLVH